MEPFRIRIISVDLQRFSTFSVSRAEIDNNTPDQITAMLADKLKGAVEGLLQKEVDVTVLPKGVLS